MSVDWLKIKTEYVTTQISLRDLAQKHGVSFSTVSRRSDKENWVQLRKEHEKEVSTKVIQKAAEASSCTHADRMAELIELSHCSAQLLGARLMQMAQTGKIKTYEVKAITEALKNVRDLYRTDETAADDDPLVKYMEEMRRA